MESKRSEEVTISDVTKDRLKSLMNGLASFESEMLEGTRERREKDEHVLVEMQNEMAVLEKSLNSEINKRVEANKSLQEWCAEQLQDLKEELLSSIQVRMDELQQNIDALNNRVDELENDLGEQKELIPADIERRGAELTQRLTEFQDLFERERLCRLEREKEITQRIAVHENKVQGEFDIERNEREQKYQELRAILEESISARKNRVNRFHMVVEKEIATLKNAIMQESILREKEDDEICDTLTTYVNKIQDSLRVINTTDV